MEHHVLPEFHRILNKRSKEKKFLVVNILHHISYMGRESTSIIWENTDIKVNTITFSKTSSVKIWRTKKWKIKKRVSYNLKISENNASFSHSFDRAWRSCEKPLVSYATFYNYIYYIMHKRTVCQNSCYRKTTKDWIEINLGTVTVLLDPTSKIHPRDALNP